ncbi:MAG TPA: DUF397 domain-containing protein [Pseudonocardiaceae bacterium]|jgi:hypothetical protein|nr:DUF397 domain-containing protein [Pseudonocardiaceae bacterium]
MVPLDDAAHAVWRKSSYSNGNGGECVEVAWRKSTYSNGNGGACVEVALPPGGGLIRDSKNPSGPVLRGDLTALLDMIKEDRA